ncbi:hypothetical protein J4218_03570 [Candidatus Pacearchaeota archaeon]|nr:hypothetical protein [Candidatus Pacearchaeota archaeon]
MAGKQTKVLIRRRKFLEVEIPIIRSKIELIGNTNEELVGKTIKLDLTRQLKGKSVEAVVKIKLENKKPVAHPEKIKLMSYFIRRMIRKRISYVEDSFATPSQDSMLLIKPFLITRKRVSKAVRRTLRNKCKNWLQDYIAEKKDEEIFNEVLINKLQKGLSLYLKKTYPLSLCEIRILEIKRPLNPEEVPKIKPKPIEKKKEYQEEVIDQFGELEEERIKKAEKEIKDTQETASKIEKEESEEENSSDSKKSESATPKKERKPRKKKEEKTE